MKATDLSRNSVGEKTVFSPGHVDIIKMSSSSKTFGDVLHGQFTLGKAGLPAGMDPSIARPGAEKNFLSDDIKVILGMPCDRKAKMALGAHARRCETQGSPTAAQLGTQNSRTNAVNGTELTEFMQRVGTSVDRLDELLCIYDDIDNHMGGESTDRVHAVIQNSVHLASRIKGGQHLPLTAVGQWLDKSRVQLQHEETMLHELNVTYSDVRLPAPRSSCDCQCLVESVYAAAVNRTEGTRLHHASHARAARVLLPPQ